jgi:hypothetical protein
MKPEPWHFPAGKGVIPTIFFPALDAGTIQNTRNIVIPGWEPMALYRGSAMDEEQVSNN